MTNLASISSNGSGPLVKPASGVSLSKLAAMTMRMAVASTMMAQAAPENVLVGPDLKLVF
jgi:hypothetical protein